MMCSQKINLKLSLYLFVFLSLGNIQCSTSNKTIHVFGSLENDLTSILTKIERIDVKAYHSPMEAVENAGQGEAVMILSDEYPEKRVKLPNAFFSVVKEKELRVYIEFPLAIPGVELGESVEAKYERVVVNSSFFENQTDSLNILSVGGFNYIPSNVKNGYMVAARVAGFDSAIFGLPKKTNSILFELPEQHILISTTNLSQFVSGRYAPQQSWGGVWKSIINYILPGANITKLTWEPDLKTSYTKNEKLPKSFQKQAVEKGINWYLDSKMLVPDNFEGTIEDAFDIKKNSGWISWNDTIPTGDGSNGVFECIFSNIDENGSQPIGIVRRADCTGESAMAFACAGKTLGNPEYTDIAQKLIDYFLFESPATKKEYSDPDHGAYGLVAWGLEGYNWFKANYGDDNARLFIGVLASAALTDTDRWDEKIMRALLAQLRTTGKNGFRPDRIDLPDFERNGWRHYYDSETINLSPHMEAYLWACMLWAYDKTGDSLFLERTEKAIRLTMENYPYGLRWMNGLAQERARMLLPLSWLVRVNDTPENREMLLKVVNDVINLQDECGAIREELGDIKNGVCPPPQSNEAYGTGEASLIAQNGDKVSDLLYTTNFAFLGLHEAYYATKDPTIKEANDRLAEFLCRVQVDSEKHPEIDGGWMRAFDFERFEHWGSNADHGWGAWAIESGWTQGWIVTILSLREENLSIWDLTKDSKINKHYKELKKEMLPGI